MDSKIEKLALIAQTYETSLTHFLVSVTKNNNGISGLSTFANEVINAGTTIAIIGGLLVDEANDMISMPIGEGLFLNQSHMLTRATINHSCSPNAKITGFNKLISIKEIKRFEEITVDYGSISVGNGSIIIDKCTCNQSNCRRQIKTNDYKFLPVELLAVYARHAKEQQEK